MPRKTTDPYEVLGLSRGATEADVRAAYLRTPEIQPRNSDARSAGQEPDMHGREPRR